MHVSDVMTKDPHTVPPEASLETAMRLMEEKRVRHLPVLDHGKLCGILSDRDLLEATGWRIAPAREKLVRDLMQKEVKTLDIEDTLVAASMAIFLEGIGCMPVLRDKLLCGMLSERDLLRTFVDQHRQGTLDEETENPVVSEWMTSNVFSLTPDDTLADAIQLCRSKHIRHVPLVEDGKYRSFLSDRDLRGAMGRKKPEDTKLRDLMPKGTLRTRENERAAEVASAMLEVRISALPVLRDEALVGIVTTENLLEHCMNALWR